MRIVSLVAVVFSFVSFAHAAEPQLERQYLVKLKFGQSKVNAKADDPTTKVQCAPQLMLTESKTANIKTGGEILLPDFGTKAVEHAETGISAEVNCRRVDNDSVRLDLKMNYKNVTENQPAMFVLSDVGAHILLKAKLNTPVKMVLNEKYKIATWVEVEVEEIMGDPK